MFGEISWVCGLLVFGMATVPTDIDTRVLADTAAPDTDHVELLDVRELGPPKPLTETLERLMELPQGSVLIQLNDRAPQHLYPRLDSRGFAYETVEYDGVVTTAIWHAE